MENANMGNEEKLNVEPVAEIFDIGNDKYIYNLKYLSARRMLQAISLFKLHQKMELNMPVTVEELKILIARETEANAFAAILIKVKMDADGNITEFYKYDPHAINLIDPLDVLKGIDDMNRLWKCRNDFFINTGLHLNESLLQLPDIMRMMAGADNKKAMSEILGAAVKIASLEENAEKQKSTGTTNTKKSKGS
jgi:hypothetical protein